MRSCGIRERMRVGDRWIMMSCPGSCFSFATPAATSPLMRCELFHSSFFSVLEATYLGIVLNLSANPSLSLRLGHAAANPSYVTRPRRSASEAMVSSSLYFPISAFQYANDHFCGSSTTPSRDMNRVAANCLVGCVDFAGFIMFTSYSRDHPLECAADTSGFGDERREDKLRPTNEKRGWGRTKPGRPRLVRGGMLLVKHSNHTRTST